MLARSAFLEPTAGALRTRENDPGPLTDGFGEIIRKKWRRRESKTSINPDTSGACTDSRALAATFVMSGRFEFGTVGFVWATGGQTLAAQLARADVRRAKPSGLPGTD